MNYQELVEKINEHGFGEICKSAYSVGKESDLIPGLKLVHREGGGEGGGEYVERVFQFEDSDLFVKITGYYYSYEGTTYDGIEQVAPQQKTITVYEKL